jgi:hypothetical protein
MFYRVDFLEKNGTKFHPSGSVWVPASLLTYPEDGMDRSMLPQAWGFIQTDLGGYQWRAVFSVHLILFLPAWPSTCLSRAPAFCCVDWFKKPGSSFLCICCPQYVTVLLLFLFIVICLSCRLTRDLPFGGFKEVLDLSFLFFFYLMHCYWSTWLVPIFQTNWVFVLIWICSSIILIT